MPDDAWRNRRAFLLGLVWFHAAVIALVGPVLGYSWERSWPAFFHDGTVLHTVGEGLIVAAFALLASWRRAGRTFQASAIALGLMSSSAILVHLSGGYIELHFHFFVMLAFLALLQDWMPFLLAIAYVAVHHGIVGASWPEEVFNHPAAIAAPWTWAGIHAFFILGSSVAGIAAWRFNEVATAKIKAQSEELESVNTLQADFVAMVAHDLRSPLGNVMAAASMLHNGILGPVSEEQIHWLDKIEASSKSMVSLINDFLDISKMEAGRLDLVKEDGSGQPARAGPAPGMRRPAPPRPGAFQPAEQRDQVHAARQGDRNRSAPDRGRNKNVDPGRRRRHSRGGDRRAFR